MKSIPMLSLTLFGALALGACSDGVTDPASAFSKKGPESNEMSEKGNALPPGDLSITEIALTEGFDSLVAALTYVDRPTDDGGQDAGLVELFLNGTDQFTVFAPTDGAFENLFATLSTQENPVNGIEDLPSELVLDVLLYHVTEGRRGSNSVVPPNMPRKIETLLGQTFSVESDGLITTTYPNTANFVPDFIDISASNGIIHVIDAVLLPSDDTSDEYDDDNNQRRGEPSIAETAIAAGFDSLVAALTYVDRPTDDGGQDAGLVELFLNGTDQFTVFAPTDGAFEDLFATLSTQENPVNGIEDLPSELVLDVLLYHVTEGRRGSNSVVPPKMPRKIETLLGETFSVDSDGLITTAYPNTANFVPDFIDISASNGVIHVIDAVLLPEL